MTRIDDPVMDRLRAADPLPLDDLARLMREGAAPDLSTPAAGPARRRRVLWGAATAAAVAGVAGVLVVSLPRGEERPAVPGNIGILDRPATDADRLPEWVTEDELMVERGIDASSARLAQTLGGRRYYVARSDRRIAGQGRMVCLIEAPVAPPPLPPPSPPNTTNTMRAPGGGVLLCNAPSVFARRFVAVPVPATGTAVPDVIGIVPDGFDRATAGPMSTEVRGNVFVLQAARGPDPVIATGPAGERRAYAGITVAGDPDVTPGDLDARTSVLARPPVAADRLPPAVVRAAVRAARRPGGVAADTRGARFAGEHAGRRHWILRDRRGAARFVVATVSPSGSVSFRDVAMPTRRNPLNLVMQFGTTEAFGPMRGGLLGMVPDGFTEVLVDGRSFPITGNLIALHGIPMSAAPSVELRGPAGVLRRTLVLGGFNTDVVAIPSNRVPEGAADLLRGAARTSRLGRLRSATVSAGTPGQVAAATGDRVRTGIGGRLWVLTGTDGRRTVVVVATLRANGRPVPVMQLAVSSPIDQSALGRVRPLALTP